MHVLTDQSQNYWPYKHEIWRAYSFCAESVIYEAIFRKTSVGGGVFELRRTTYLCYHMPELPFIFKHPIVLERGKFL